MPWPRVWDTLRGTFWFVPTLCAALAIMLAIGLLVADHRLDGGFAGSYWSYSGSAEGARSLLSAVAGSIITVVGLAFSITIVALQLAAAQLGPRLLRNFVRDPGNQIVLGVFVGTFVYCLVVLRAIRGQDSFVDAFVPQLSVTGAVLLAILSVGVLIYFIHHAAISMQADQVIAAVASELDGAIAKVFPEHMGHGEAGDGEPGDGGRSAAGPPASDTTPVGSRDAGYVQSINGDELVAVAREHDVVVRLTCCPGDFVAEGDIVAHAWPASRVDADVQAAVAGAVALGIQRTMLQDVLFGFEQLVEISINALASNVRDPITASRCVDRLGAAVDRVALRAMPSPHRHDADGHLRVIAPVLSIEDVVAAAFDAVRAHGRPSRIVSVRLLETFTRLVGKHRRRDLHVALLPRARSVLRGGDALGDALDREVLRRHFEDFVRHLRDDARRDDRDVSVPAA